MPKPRVDTKNALIVKREEYVNALEAILAGGFCPFCEKHLFKHHRRPLIFKGRYWLVTENSWPYEGARLHFLFIARPHIEATEKISTVMWGELQSLYRKLVKKYQLSGATLVIRSGDTRFTGASVNHLHGHVVVGTARTKKTEPIRALIGFKR
ncbi:HIT domain-containing protein [Candidatus Kaiserbacteria bacterium]|nr:HIT domain-containing protein [Candidatus Kaiserbacteria bacterium]